ncbi:hypothetical protein GIW81_00105 [Hyphomicrobium sp. xq]|uniref:Secretin/TonB short N-terminal domain-containing protein n=1 Tax=Hyphomicrobium album TaxID=2665159 RepID=A0A6I3KBC8_9HYPH|nr:hypothetical protein [Hyphomicrobium album]MTD92735.1 hypothetical protein [Hyphomicrobium album]
MFLSTVIAVDGAALSAEPRAPEQAIQVDFNIPSQPLMSALEAFSASSGYQILMGDRAFALQRSAPLKGSFTPREALMRMVATTRAKVRFTASSSAILLQDDSSAYDGPVDTSAADEKSRFEAALQGDVLRALCRDAGLRRAVYRAAIDLWIHGSGGVERAELLASTGSPYLDSRILKVLRSLASAVPPRGLRRPTTLLIAPNLSRPDEVCAAAPPMPTKLRQTAGR